jgi:hypothetical protein
MPSTWNHHSQLVYGEVLEITANRERYVVHMLLEMWLNAGLDEKAIALRWNAGGAKQCSSGINKHGVEFDSCAYQHKVLAQLR